jgi:hypothetical protein
MRFFVPHTNDVQAQRILHRLIRGNVESQVRRVSDRRIHRVTVREDLVRVVEVGRPLFPGGDDVFAIFLAADASAVYACTPARGMFNDSPVEFSIGAVMSIDEFAAE